MDMIADTKTMPYSGQIFVNGCERDRGPNAASIAFAKARGYVAQIDDANGERMVIIYLDPVLVALVSLVDCLCAYQVSLPSARRSISTLF